jgi:hypothetical protein
LVSAQVNAAGRFKGARTIRARSLNGQRLLTKAEIARTYGVSPATISNRIREGKLTPTRVGKIDRVAEADWLHYLATGEPQAPATSKITQ